MMKRYRIYTEQKNKEEVMHLLNNWLGGSTLYCTIGVWQGQIENSWIIEYISDTEIAKEVIFELAKEIKILSNQQSILVTQEDIVADFI